MKNAWGVQDGAMIFQTRSNCDDFNTGMKYIILFYTLDFDLQEVGVVLLFIYAEY